MVSNNNSKDCIDDFINFIVFNDNEIDAFKTHYNTQIQVISDNQFNIVTSEEECVKEIMLLKNNNNKLNYAEYLFKDEFIITLSDFEKKFGSFKSLPGRFGKKPSTLCNIEGENDVSYALILTGESTMDADTQIKKMTIRVDYPIDK
jgi:hypothetical protein